MPIFAGLCEHLAIREAGFEDVRSQAGAWERVDPGPLLARPGRGGKRT